MVKTPIKIQLVKTLADVGPSRIVAVKNDGDTTFSLYITDKQGIPFPIKDNSGIITITNTDGNLDINGTDINISPALLSIINSALQSGGDISELVNDVGYLTIDNLPTKTSEFINDGSDGTTTYIENDELGLVAFSNDYNDLDNLPNIPSIDNLVPYTGANKDVNIASNYFKTSKGFEYRNGLDYFKVSKNGENAVLDFGGSNSLDYLVFTIQPQGGLYFLHAERNSYNNNVFTVSKSEVYAKKRFLTDEGFGIINGTANQALTANGGTFDLTTKADLVSGKIPASQLPAYVDDVLEFANLASFPATG